MRQKTKLSSTSQFLTAGQAAELLGVTDRHIYNMCNAGKIKSVKLGNSIRINRAEFLEQIGLTEADYIAAITAEEAAPAAVAVAE